LTGFTRLKLSPGTPTITRIREWSDRLDWLTALLDPTPFLKDIAFTKIRQFAAEASANEISDIRNTRNERRRHALLLCLLHQAQTQTRDDLVKMFLRRIKKTENAAREKLGLLQQDHRALEESLIAAFAQVLDHAGVEQSSDACFGRDVRNLFQELGGVEHLKNQHEKVSVFHKNNYMPLMQDIHARHRSLLFRLFDLLKIESSHL